MSRGRAAIVHRGSSEEHRWTFTSTRRGPSSSDYGVPGAQGRGRRHAQDAHARRPRLGGARRGQGAGQDGRPGQGRRCEARRRPGRGRADGTPILGMDIKGHTVGKVMLAQPVDIETEFYVSYVLDRAAGASSPSPRPKAAWRSRRSPRPARRPSPAYTSTRPKASPRRRRARSPRPPDCPRRPSPVLVRLWEVLVARGRRPRRGQSARPHRVRATSSPSTARSPSTTTPASGRPVGVPTASRTTIRWRRRPPRRASTTSSSTARSASSATARAWSCRPSTWSPAAAPGPPTSSTSAAVPRPRSWPTDWGSSCPTRL